MRISLNKEEVRFLRDILVWVHQQRMDAAKNFEDRIAAGMALDTEKTVEAFRQAALDDALEVRKLKEKLDAALDREAARTGGAQT